MQTTSTTNDRDFVIIANDFNRRVGWYPLGFQGVYSGHDFGPRNEEGIRLLGFCDANDVTFYNTNSENQPPNHLSILLAHKPN